MDILKEIFDVNGVNFTMESRVQTAPRSACDCFFIGLTTQPASTSRLSYPRMKEDQAVVSEKLHRIQ